MAARISKKAAQEISNNINSLLVWQDILKQNLNEKRWDASDLSRKAFNDAADALIAIGIVVHKYKL